TTTAAVRQNDVDVNPGLKLLHRISRSLDAEEVRKAVDLDNLQLGEVGQTERGNNQARVLFRRRAGIRQDDLHKLIAIDSRPIAEHRDHEIRAGLTVEKNEGPESRGIIAIGDRLRIAIGRKADQARVVDIDGAVIDE